MTKLLEENPGELSVMRVAMAAVVGTTLMMFIVSNLVMLINVLIHGSPLVMVDVPANMMGMSLGVLGAKSIQKFGEK